MTRDIIYPDQVGRGRKYRTRYDIFRGMEIGECVFFHADGSIAQASVRGSAYCYGRSAYKRFYCTKVVSTVVCVKRMADTYVPRSGPMEGAA